eukprot:6222937-Pyramimonas_sp.AAC.1
MSVGICRGAGVHSGGGAETVPAVRAGAGVASPRIRQLRARRRPRRARLPHVGARPGGGARLPQGLGFRVLVRRIQQSRRDLERTKVSFGRTGRRSTAKRSRERALDIGRASDEGVFG